MPWSKNNLPDSAKNLTEKGKEIFVSVANDVLEETGDEAQAVMAGLAQAKEQTNKSLTKDGMLKAFTEFLEKHFDGSSKEDDVKVENVAKSVNVEKKLFTAVVLRPNDIDAHGDVYDEDTVEKACHNFSQFCRKANLQHLVEVDDITFVENYIAPQDFQLGDGMVFKGDWVATAKINNDEVWEMCKNGTFTGFSVGCLATTEKIND